MAAPAAGEPAAAAIATTVVRPILRVAGTRTDALDDALALEEPLEIRLAGPGFAERTVSLTMRTPGHDLELAAGFLHGEGLLPDASALADLRACGPAAAHGGQNVVRVQLAPGVAIDPGRLERHFYTTSSCGVCGKTSIEALGLAGCPDVGGAGPALAPDLLAGLPGLVRAHQRTFDRTGGLHAAALVDAATGQVVVVREDVGRHNALDKAVGHQLLAGALPLSGAIVFVSGRASFELVQKALMAGAPVLAAVGAPSSLAVELAAARGMTLLGFLREGRFNVYSGAHRLRAPAGLAGGPTS